MAALRAIAFLASAVGVELARGPGLAAFIAALLLGHGRWRLTWLLLVAVAGTTASTLLPGPDGGKVAHGLSNAGFLSLVYVVLCGLGYALGRLARRAR